MILEVAAAMTVFTFGPTLLGVHFAHGLKLRKRAKGSLLLAVTTTASSPGTGAVCDSR